jgi:CHAD domain-containing protein
MRMPDPAAKLDRPALTVITRIARRQLRATDATWERLRRADDDEALHDFRVAVRRLRSTLQAYRAQLGDVVRPKDRHRLRRLADATGTARDAEVQIARLVALRRELGADAQVVVAPMLRRLRRRMRDGYATARARIEAGYPPAARALERRLRRAEATGDALPFRMVIGRLVASHTADLRPLLERVPTLGAPRVLHEARIEAKRLRYVLEPVRRMVPGSTLLVHRLERLQDLLGDLHDLQVLEQTLAAARPHEPSPRAFLVLTRLVRGRQRRLYAELLRGWLGPHAAAVLGPLDLLTTRLGAGRRPALPIRMPAAAPVVVVSRQRRC